MSALEEYRQHKTMRSEVNGIVVPMPEKYADAAIAELEAELAALRKRLEFGPKHAETIYVDDAVVFQLRTELAEAQKWLAVDEPWIQVQEAKDALEALKKTAAICMTIIEEKNGEIAWRDQELKRLGDTNKANAVVMPLAQARCKELAEERADGIGELLKAEATIERLTWMLNEAVRDMYEAFYAKSGVSEVTHTAAQLHDLERRWAERGGE